MPKSDPLDAADPTKSNLTKSYTFPIVGSFYRWPAAAILDTLKIGTPLTLQAEPTNPVDPNAIRILVDRERITARARFILRVEQDIVVSDLPPQIHLGYIVRAAARTLRLRGFAEAIGKFSIGAQGGYKVIVELKIGPNVETPGLC